VHQYLTFLLGQEVFAMGILAIKEIVEYSSVTTVPLMPAYVRGVVNLRGSVVPVIDLAVRFRKPPAEPTRRTCIVILEVPSARERHDIAVVVDAVNSVLEIPPSEIEPRPSFGLQGGTDHLIQGMGKVNGRFVVLLSPEHLLTCEEVDSLATTATAA
jgi:purine-binding chemotaxis protein CheW